MDILALVLIVAGMICFSAALVVAYRKRHVYSHAVAGAGWAYSSAILNAAGGVILLVMYR